MSQLSSVGFEQMKQSPMYQAWSVVAPDVDAFPALMDKTGDLLRRPYDWTEEIKQLSIPTLLVYGDADSVPPSHAAAYFALLGGGLKDAGGTVRCPQTCASPSSPASPTTTSSTPNSWQTSSPSSPADSGATEGADAAQCRVPRRRRRLERQASRSSQRHQPLDFNLQWRLRPSMYGTTCLAGRSDVRWSRHSAIAPFLHR
jgi:hypothetical protein